MAKGKVQVAQQIELDDWVTADQAAALLAAKKGQSISKDYPRQLASRGKIRARRLTTKLSLYSRDDINGFVFNRVGRPAREKGI